MQMVKYVSPWGETFTAGVSPPYVFESIRGVEGVDVEHVTTKAPGQDGNSVHAVTMTDRPITLRVYVKGADRENLYRSRHQLTRILRPNAGAALPPPGTFYYTTDYGTWLIPARPYGVPKFNEARIREYLLGEIQFRCPNPLFRSLEPTTVQLAYTDGGFRFPLRLPARFGRREWVRDADNPGSAPSPPLIKIYGPADNPRVTLATTGEYLQVNRTLAEGDVLTIDATRGKKRVELSRANGGDIENAFGYLTFGSRLFLLPPGNNRLRYASNNDSSLGRVIVTYYTWEVGL